MKARRWTDVVSPAAQARLGDAACALVAFVLGGLAMDATTVASSDYAAVNDLVGLTAVLALFWRRRFPVAVAILTWVAGAAAPLAAGAAIVSVFSLAAERGARVPGVLALLYVTAGVVSVVAFPDEQLGALGSMLVGLLLTLTALGWGLVVRSRRQLLATYAERAERAEAEQQARVADARRAERTRIATEMHDVLAHRLSMLSLHAGAIELRPEAPAEELSRAAAVVRASAHLALEELRQVIGVLRDGDAGLAPQPTLADLDGLVAGCRAAGMAVELERPADGVAVPDELGRHVYRIVQEALTNAGKHAPGQPVRVSVGADEGHAVRILVCNPVTGAPGAIPGAGAGLVGLRERVGLLHGRLDAGVGADGTHRLEAELPWPA